MPILKCVCGAKYNVPDEWAGKRVKCKKCGEHFTIPAKRVADPEPEDEFRLAPVEEQEARISSMAAASASTRAGSSVSTPAMGAPDENGWVSVGDKGAATSFWGDVGRAFVFFIDPGNLVTFLILCAVASLQVVLGYAGCLGVAGSFIINGWLCSFYFNTIVEAASGEKSLPEFGLTGGIVEDVLVPFFKYLSTLLIAAIPAGVYVLIVGVSIPKSLSEVDFALIGLMGFGVFMWPFILLSVALGGVETFYRPDLVLKSVAKTFPQYLCVCILMSVAVGGTVILNIAASLGESALTKHPIIFQMVMYIPTQYAWIVAMMLIGMYYHHCKHRFAWSWG